MLGVGLREAEAVVRRFGGDNKKMEGGASEMDGDEEDDRGVRVRVKEVLVRRWVQIRDMLEGVRGNLNLGEEMRSRG